MAATGTVVVSSTISGLPSGSKTISPPAIALAAAVGQITDTTLASGANTITVPTGTTMAVCVFPVTSGSVILKGVTGDTGVTLINNPSVITWAAFPLAAAQTTFVLTASVSISGVEINFV